MKSSTAADDVEQLHLWSTPVTGWSLLRSKMMAGSPLSQLLSVAGLMPAAVHASGVVKRGASRSIMLGARIADIRFACTSGEPAGRTESAMLKMAPGLPMRPGNQVLPGQAGGEDSFRHQQSGESHEAVAGASLGGLVVGCCVMIGVNQLDIGLHYQRPSWPASQGNWEGPVTKHDHGFVMLQVAGARQPANAC
jgi:hypothetical protein